MRQNDEPNIPEGWTRWPGGECPEDARGECVDVIFRDGVTLPDENNPAPCSEHLYWKHDGMPHDIIGYRVHQPSQPEPTDGQFSAADMSDAREAGWRDGVKAAGSQIVGYGAFDAEGKLIAYKRKREGECQEPIYRAVAQQADCTLRDKCDCIGACKYGNGGNGAQQPAASSPEVWINRCPINHDRNATCPRCHDSRPPGAKHGQPVAASSQPPVAGDVEALAETLDSIADDTRAHALNGEQHNALRDAANILRRLSSGQPAAVKDSLTTQQAADAKDAAASEQRCETGLATCGPAVVMTASGRHYCSRCDGVANGFWRNLLATSPQEPGNG